MLRFMGLQRVGHDRATELKRLFSCSLLFAVRVVSSPYLRFIFLPSILIPACNSSSLVFLMR